MSWFLAIRPKTLGISVAPVVVGTSIAWTETAQIHWLPALTALAALAATLLIQIGTNLHNDAKDFERGADTGERLGPARATAQGWFSAAKVKRAAHGCFGLAFLAGIYLALVGGWPIVIIGLLSLAAGYAYTGSPWPIAYTPFGELFVFLFFGLAAVMGSYYLQTLHFSLDAFLPASAIGLLAAAILLVNNYRDLETDEKAGKLTLTHYLGRRGGHALYGLLLLLPFLLPSVLMIGGPESWLILLLLPHALMLWRRFVSQAPGPSFNRLLADTAKLQLAYGVLLSIGLWLSKSSLLTAL